MRGNQKQTKWRACVDALSELTGAYRATALSHHAVIARSAYVKSPSRLLVGRKVTIQRGSIVHCGGKAWSGFEGYVKLGDGVVIGPYCVLYGAGGIKLEDYVHLGPGVQLMSQAGRHNSGRLGAHPTYNLAPIRVGAGSWIGAGAVIVGGVSIGRCVNVAPNSVVSRDVPDYAVVVGNPGRVIMKNEAIE